MSLKTSWHAPQTVHVRAVLWSVIKQCALPALIAVVWVGWEQYSLPAPQRVASITVAKDGFLLFSFLMFFGNLWQRTEKRIEDKADFGSIGSHLNRLEADVAAVLEATRITVVAEEDNVSFPPFPPDSMGLVVKRGPRRAKNAAERELDKDEGVAIDAVFAENAQPRESLILLGAAMERRLRAMLQDALGKTGRTVKGNIHYLVAAGKIDAALTEAASEFLTVRSALLHGRDITELQVRRAGMLGAAILHQLRIAHEADMKVKWAAR